MTSTKMTWEKWTTLVSLLAATALVCIPALGQSKTQPVLVVNGSGQPVPTAAQGTTNVAGTVNIGNAPSVNVTNTPTVNLATGGSVNVTNPPNGQNNPTPLAVLEATQPYQDTCSMTISGGINGTCNFQTVPSGKRLIIQEFDAFGQVQRGLKPIFISVYSGIYHSFPATFMGSGNTIDNFNTHQETRLYVGSDHAPICDVDLSDVTQASAYTCAFSGFLIDVP
jgi:hypothetical protein